MFYCYSLLYLTIKKFTNNFTNEYAVEIVNHCWLVEVSSECYWPPEYFKHKDIFKAVRNLKLPEINWEKLNCKVLGFYSKLYLWYVCHFKNCICILWIYQKIFKLLRKKYKKAQDGDNLSSSEIIMSEIIHTEEQSNIRLLNDNINSISLSPRTIKQLVKLTKVGFK